MHPLATAAQVFPAVQAAEVPAALVELANPYQAGGLNKTMIISKDPQVKENIKKRLARIEGQLRGVQKMIDDNRDCREILQQLIAIRAGVQSASLNFMQDVANECLLNTDNQSDPEFQRALMADLIKMMSKVS